MADHAPAAQAPRARRLRAAAAALLLAGCAPMAWHRADSDAAVTARDLDECQRSGRLDASQVALSSPPPAAPVVITTASGATVVQTVPLPVTSLDPTLAQQITMECMHKKGYRLVKEK